MSYHASMQIGPFVECKKVPGLEGAELSSWILQDRIGSERLHRADGGEQDPTFVPDGYDVWFSNSDAKGNCTRSVSEDDDILIDLTDVNLPAEIQSFSEAFAAEIKALSDFYGPENVRLRWGIVHYNH